MELARGDSLSPGIRAPGLGRERRHCLANEWWIQYERNGRPISGPAALTVQARRAGAKAR
jgi:hypothetical protein